MPLLENLVIAKTVESLVFQLRNYQITKLPDPPSLLTSSAVFIYNCFPSGVGKGGEIPPLPRNCNRRDLGKKPLSAAADGKALEIVEA